MVEYMNRLDLEEHDGHVGDKLNAAWVLHVAEFGKRDRDLLLGVIQTWMTSMLAWSE